MAKAQKVKRLEEKGCRRGTYGLPSSVIITVFMRYKLTVFISQWLNLLLGMLINEAAVDVPCVFERLRIIPYPGSRVW